MRLIDADTLIKNLSYLYTKNHIPVDMRAKEILTTIMEQPTAYDIDKVVKELYEERTEILLSNDYECEIINYCIDNFDKAIEIVKQGGVSDDTDNMCEWRLCDEEANVYDTSCRNPHILIEGTPQENNYEFCPYCGKKIKTVGD